MVELSDYVPVNFICVAVLGALALRRLVRMEKFHWLRVVILTGLLWVPAVYLLTLPYECLSQPDCSPMLEESDVYTCTEM